MDKACFHIYYHSDLDGIISAILMANYIQRRHALKAGEINFSPVDFNEKSTWHTKAFVRPFAVVDFLYHPDAMYWVDHHIDPFINEDYKARYELAISNHEKVYWSSEYKSASKLIYEKILKSGMDKEPHKLRKNVHLLVSWAEKIDSANYKDVNEWFNCENNAIKLNLVLLYNHSKEFMNRIVRRVVDNGLKDIANYPDICNLFMKAKAMMDHEFDVFSKHASYNAKVVFFDVTSLKGFKYHRFFSYKAHPDANFTVGIYNKSDAFEISVGRNPWGKARNGINIGHLCRSFNGGGHCNVGGITVHNKKIAMDIANKIITLLSS